MSDAKTEQNKNGTTHEWRQQMHPKHFEKEFEFQVGDEVEYKGGRYVLIHGQSSEYPLHINNIGGFTKSGKWFLLDVTPALKLINRPSKEIKVEPDFTKLLDPSDLVIDKATSFSNEQPSTGNKLDSGKPKISLIPSEAITEMAIAFTYGASKYEADNFKNGIKFRRLIDAAFRHLLAISNGEDVDSESLNSHVGHCMASLAMLTYMMHNKPELDDRFNKGGSK